MKNEVLNSKRDNDSTERMWTLSTRYGQAEALLLNRQILPYQIEEYC